MLKEFLKEAKINYIEKKHIPIKLTNPEPINPNLSIQEICTKLDLPYLSENYTKIEIKKLLFFLMNFKLACKNYFLDLDFSVDELFNNDKLIQKHNELDLRADALEIELARLKDLPSSQLDLKKLTEEINSLSEKKKFFEMIKNENQLAAALLKDRRVVDYLKEKRIRKFISTQSPTIIRDIIIVLLDNEHVKIDDLVKVLKSDRTTILRIVFYFKERNIINHDVMTDVISLVG